eukprot:3038-Heterococcus_DN1.PRE.3
MTTRQLCTVTTSSLSDHLAHEHGCQLCPNATYIYATSAQTAPSESFVLQAHSRVRAPAMLSSCKHPFDNNGNNSTRFSRLFEVQLRLPLATQLTVAKCKNVCITGLQFRTAHADI